MTSLYDFPGMNPVHFFAISIPLYQMTKEGMNKGHFGEKYMLPATATLCSEELQAEVYSAWNEEGMAFCFLTKKTHAMRTIELFLDTRDVKTTGYNTRYCHHFLYDLTEDVCVAKEVTHFRGLEKRPLALSNLLFVKKESSSNKVCIILPKEALFGFEPSQFNRLGMNYRITFATSSFQHGSASGSDYKIEEEPSLWASCLLR